MAGKDLDLSKIDLLYPSLFIKPPEGDEIDAREICPGLDFNGDDSNPVMTNTYTQDAGTDGSVYSYSQIANNTVTARFTLHFSDYYDYKLKKHELARFFMQKGLYRIRTDAEPGKVKFVRAGSYTIEDPHMTTYRDFSIPFENPSGVQWSFAYSDQLMNYDQNLWQVGMNLPNGENLQYHFVNQHQFRVYNASDIDIDPRQRYPLQIAVTGFSGSFDMINQTTGDEVVYTGGLKSNDTLLLDGLSVYKNGKLANSDTNLAWFRLKHGWNEFKIFGYRPVDIRFHFRFVYLG